MNSEQRDNGRALIAGASGGIGTAVSRELANNGISLALVGRDAAKLESVAESCRSSAVAVHSVVCDLAASESIKPAVQQAIDKLGGLNYLVNCAGISRRGQLHESDLADAEAVLDVNLRAHMHLARYALPEINKHGGGAVIKIGAVNHAYTGVNTYTAANLGADGLAEAMFEDVREFGTRVCTIKPGWVNTPLVTAANIDKELMIQPQDVARAVLFMIRMPESACVTQMTILPQRSPYI